MVCCYIPNPQNTSEQSHLAFASLSLALSYHSDHIPISELCATNSSSIAHSLQAKQSATSTTTIIVNKAKYVEWIIHKIVRNCKWYYRSPFWPISTSNTGPRGVKSDTLLSRIFLTLVLYRRSSDKMEIMVNSRMLEKIDQQHVSYSSCSFFCLYQDNLSDSWRRWGKYSAIYIILVISPNLITR